jgi:hypothetical protein
MPETYRLKRVLASGRTYQFCEVWADGEGEGDGAWEDATTASAKIKTAEKEKRFMLTLQESITVRA